MAVDEAVEEAPAEGMAASSDAALEEGTEFVWAVEAGCHVGGSWRTDPESSCSR